MSSIWCLTSCAIVISSSLFASLLFFVIKCQFLSILLCLLAPFEVVTEHRTYKDVRGWGQAVWSTAKCLDIGEICGGIPRAFQLDELARLCSWCLPSVGAGWRDYPLWSPHVWFFFSLIKLVNLVLYLNGSVFKAEEIKKNLKSPHPAPSGTHTSTIAPTTGWTQGIPEFSEAPQP